MNAEDIVLFVVKYGYTKTSIAYVQKALDETKAQAIASQAAQKDAK